VGRRLDLVEVLARVPQQEPFRFIDEILEIDEEHIVARYTYPPESDFYRGHFPGNPVTPGVILVETMAQAGVVAQGIFKLCLESDEAELDKILTVFTDVSVDFTGTVQPGDRVTITGSVVFWRRRKLKAKVEMKLDDGTVVCAGELSGMGVLQ
jgi:3-hydroxyacyl-[acyl-carrier-protein] dehydratase